MADLSKNLRTVKANAIVAALPPTTKYSYDNNITVVVCLYRYLDCVVGNSASQKKEGKKERGF